MNIVTIDFDIIMHWSVAFYNDLLDDDTTIIDIMNDNPNSNFIPHADLFLYRYLTEYILECARSLPKERIKFIESHEEVTKIFDNGTVRSKFNILNIDHHHDIAYDDDDVENEIEELTCGNWVKYLFEKYRNDFQEYIWINDDESVDFEASAFFKRKIKRYNIKLYNLYNLAKTTDYLFICKSTPWIPSNEQELYDNWKYIIDYLYKK